MVFLTQYTKDDQRPSVPLQYDSIEEAKATMFPGAVPFQVRPRWELFEPVAGTRVCLSTFAFS